MKKFLAPALALLLCAGGVTPAFAKGNQFKVRYKGGTSESATKDSNWNNRLTITPAEIRLDTVDGKTTKIAPEAILSVNYWQKTTRHASTWVPLAAITGATGLLWFMLDEKRKHFVGIRYDAGDDEVGAILVEVKNQDSKAFIYTLAAVTKRNIANETAKKKKWYDMD